MLTIGNGTLNTTIDKLAYASMHGDVYIGVRAPALTEIMQIIRRCSIGRRPLSHCANMDTSMQPVFLGFEKEFIWGGIFVKHYPTVARYGTLKGAEGLRQFAT